MDTTFREKIEAPVTPEIAPQSVETPDLVVGDIDAPKMQDRPTQDELRLDIWEGENKRPYGHDYFKIRELAHEFPLKAQFGAIDKYLKAEIKERGMDNTKSNYEKLIAEIEDSIGTKDLSTFNRLQRLFNYIQTVKKYREIKQKKQQYELYRKDF